MYRIYVLLSSEISQLKKFISRITCEKSAPVRAGCLALDTLPLCMSFKNNNMRIAIPVPPVPRSCRCRATAPSRFRPCWNTSRSISRGDLWVGIGYHMRYRIVRFVFPPKVPPCMCGMLDIHRPRASWHRTVNAHACRVLVLRPLQHCLCNRIKACNPDRNWSMSIASFKTYSSMRSTSNSVQRKK